MRILLIENDPVVAQRLIAAAAAILGRVPQSSIDKIPGAPQP